MAPGEPRPPCLPADGRAAHEAEYQTVRPVAQHRVDQGLPGQPEQLCLGDRECGQEHDHSDAHARGVEQAGQWPPPRARAQHGEHHPETGAVAQGPPQVADPPRCPAPREHRADVRDRVRAALRVGQGQPRAVVGQHGDDAGQKPGHRAPPHGGQQQAEGQDGRVRGEYHEPEQHRQPGVPGIGDAQHQQRGRAARGAGQSRRAVHAAFEQRRVHDGPLHTRQARQDRRRPQTEQYESEDRDHRPLRPTTTKSAVSNACTMLASAVGSGA